MAKKVNGYVKLQVPAGMANPSPPIGPALGQRGLQLDVGGAADLVGPAQRRHALAQLHQLLVLAGEAAPVDDRLPGRRRGRQRDLYAAPAQGHGEPRKHDLVAEALLGPDQKRGAGDVLASPFRHRQPRLFNPAQGTFEPPVVKAEAALIVACGQGRKAEVILGNLEVGRHAQDVQV